MRISKRMIAFLLIVLIIFAFIIVYKLTTNSSNGDDLSSQRISASSDNNSQLPKYVKYYTDIFEEGVNYYTVVISNEFDWDNASVDEQGELAQNAINLCKEKADADGYTSIDVYGLKVDGTPAFHWEQQDTIEIFIDGEYDSDYSISK